MVVGREAFQPRRLRWRGDQRRAWGRVGRKSFLGNIFLDISSRNVYGLRVFAQLPSPGLADRFSMIIGGLCRAAAARIADDRSIGPLLILLYTRLNRMAKRFAALAARAQAGPAPPRRNAARPPRPPQAKKPRLPEGFAWLVRLAGHEAACCGSQLQHLLSDPEMAVLLRAAPQAARIFRPLCKMLGQIPDPKIIPPLPPRQPRPPRAAAGDTGSDAAAPDSTEPACAKQQKPEKPQIVWRRWRGIRMPEIVRNPA